MILNRIGKAKTMSSNILLFIREKKIWYSLGSSHKAWIFNPLPLSSMTCRHTQGEVNSVFWGGEGKAFFWRPKTQYSRRRAWGDSSEAHLLMGRRTPRVFLTVHMFKCQIICNYLSCAMKTVIKVGFYVSNPCACLRDHCTPNMVGAYII